MTGESVLFDISVTERGHRLLAPHLQPGDFAIDCTAGNGRDTAFLLDRVGPAGQVWAFEIQPEAASRLAERLPGIRVICDSHGELARYAGGRQPAVILYNLGYLPGGDPSVTTMTAETLRSLRQALAILKPGGVLSVVAYPGHPEGAREAEAVRQLLEGLPAKQYEALTILQTNRSASTPVQHLIQQKNGDDHE